MRRSTGIVSLNAVIVVVSLFAAALVPTGETVAVVMPPGSTPDRALNAVSQAGGDFTAATGRDWIVVARSSDPDFARRLYAAGALAVLAPSGLLGCLTEEK